MGAPHRLRLYVSDFAVSAYILPPIETAPEGRPGCKNCAPKRTRMQDVVDVRFQLKDGFEHYKVFECMNCHAQWAATWLELTGRA